MSDGSTGAPAGAMKLRQAAVVFDEIIQLASCVNRMSILLIGNGDEDERDVVAFQTAMQALSAQIGLLADFGSSRSGGVMWRNSKIAEWLLPPVFDDSGEQQ